MGRLAEARSGKPARRAAPPGPRPARARAPRPARASGRRQRPAAGRALLLDVHPARQAARVEHVVAGRDHAPARVAGHVHRVHADHALQAAVAGLHVAGGRRRCAARGAARRRRAAGRRPARRRQRAVIVVLGRQEARGDQAARAEARLRQQRGRLRAAVRAARSAKSLHVCMAGKPASTRYAGSARACHRRRHACLQPDAHGRAAAGCAQPSGARSSTAQPAPNTTPPAAQVKPAAPQQQGAAAQQRGATNTDHLTLIPYGDTGARRACAATYSTSAAQKRGLGGTRSRLCGQPCRYSGSARRLALMPST